MSEPAARQSSPALLSALTRLSPLTRLTAVVREDLEPAERAALASWLSFAGTFAAVRGITASIRSGHGPFHNVSLGGRNGAGGTHLHHYLWGIGMLAGVGAVAVHGDEEHRNHPLVATAYGSGLALIVDEFALLLDLRDVYWARQGRVSVDVAVGGIAAAGCYFALLPVARALRRRRTEGDLGPGSAIAYPNGHGQPAGAQPGTNGHWRVV